MMRHVYIACVGYFLLESLSWNGDAAVRMMMQRYSQPFTRLMIASGPIDASNGLL